MWDWKSHVGIAVAVAVSVVALLITTEGCAQPVTVNCPDGTSVEMREHGEQGWNPSAKEIHEICEEGR